PELYAGRHRPRIHLGFRGACAPHAADRAGHGDRRGPLRRAGRLLPQPRPRGQRGLTPDRADHPGLITPPRHFGPERLRRRRIQFTVTVITTILWMLSST